MELITVHTAMMESSRTRTTPPPSPPPAEQEEAATNEWPQYESLISLICSHGYGLVSALCHVTDSESAESIAKALLCMSLRHGDVQAMACACVRAEFTSNAAFPAQIFRTQNLASRFLGSHARMVGAEYLQVTLKAVITALMDAQVNLEVDPARMAIGAEVEGEGEEEAALRRQAAVERQQTALALWAELFVTRLTDAMSIRGMPPEMRAVLAEMRSCADNIGLERKQVRRNPDARLLCARPVSRPPVSRSPCATAGERPPRWLPFFALL